MMGRRGFLASGVALAATAAARGMALPPDIRFKVLRNGGEIGQHVVTFRQDGDALLATAGVRIAVRLGPIVLFRYTHSVREWWRGDQFLKFESDTDDDGKQFRVHAVWSG